MSVETAALLRGTATQSSATDNATATATVSATEATVYLAFGVRADYDAVVAAFKTITVKHGSTTWEAFNWDFNNGPFAFNFPVALKSDPNEAVSVELEASGSSGVNGRATIYTATN